MAKSLPIVDTDVDTFNGWISKTNLIIDLANTEIVTANNHANGAITTGKGFVIGTLGANTLVCSTLSGGNTVANGNISIGSNTVVTSSGTFRINSSMTLGANSVVNEAAVVYSVSNTSTNQVITTVSKDSYRTVKWIISITDTVNDQHQSTEILGMHSGDTSNTAYSTEYATLVSNNVLGTFSVDTNSTHMRLLFSPAYATMKLNVFRTAIST